VPLHLNGGSFKKASAPPLFLEDENFFSKIGHVGTVGNSILHRTNVAEFLGKVLIFEKKEGG
jgi:hypothetical protein